MVRTAFKKCTPGSREGSTFLMQHVLLRNFPDPGTAISFLDTEFARLRLVHLLLLLAVSIEVAFSLRGLS